MAEKKYKAFCTKCRKKVDVSSAEVVTMKNGVDAVKGFCPTCTTKVFCFLGRDKK